MFSRGDFAGTVRLRDELFERDRSRCVEFHEWDSRPLRREHHEKLDPSQPVRVVLLGANGNLARGFLKQGNRELTHALGQSPIRWTMVDLECPTEERVAALRAGGYQLNENFPALSRVELEKYLTAGERFDLVISATPPSTHAPDAQWGAGLRIPTAIEKPGYRPTFWKEERQVIESAVLSGFVTLTDSSVCGDSFVELLESLDRYLEGIGATKYVHTNWTEPHSLVAEGHRAAMIMDEEVHGGFIGADQLPHALVMMHAFLSRRFGIGIENVTISDIDRARDTQVPGPEDAETCMTVMGSFAAPHGSEIEIKASCGKGLKIIGTDRLEARPTYILEIGGEYARVEECIGDGTGRVQPYIARIPNDPNKQATVWMMNGGSWGYKLFLADHVMRNQHHDDELSARRIRVQTEGSLAAIRAITDAYIMMRNDPDTFPLHAYGSDALLTMPYASRTACRIAPFVRLGRDGVSVLTS